MAKGRYLEASIWFKQAADQDDPFAQAMMGSLYESGSGVHADLRAARLLYRKAAAQGNAYAAKRLKALGDTSPIDVIADRAERPAMAASAAATRVAENRGPDFSSRRFRAAAFSLVLLGLALVLWFAIRAMRAAASQ